jgi:8-oxo-dGTP pyrophosphatase MutT (NUDIX family)
MSLRFTLPELRGPWQLLTSELRYENPWIEVFHQDVITPAKTAGIYGLVHFKGTAIGIVPIDNEGNTYLVGQFRYTLNQYSWEIPMGGCGADEEPLDCARRELEEETGLIAESLNCIQTLHTSNSITDEKGLVFVAEGLSKGTQQLEATEDISVKKLAFNEALAMVLNGEITDAISVAAIQHIALTRPELLTKG